MIGQLRIWVNADKWSINSTISEIQKIKKAGDEIEKSLNSSADKWMKKLKKEAEISLNTIAKLNDRVGNLKKNLESEVIGWKRFKELQKEIQKTERALEKVSGSWKNFFWSLQWVWWAIGWVLAITQAKDTADIFTGMQNSLKLVSEWKELDILQKKILDTANNSRVPVDALTKSFVRFDLVNKQLWGTQEETLKILDSLSKGLSMTWATTEETSSTILQLSQAFWSGVLMWDEFRAVSESMPMLLDILAKKLWVPRWELKNLASEGKITSQVLKEALIEANDEITRSFDKSQVSISQKLTQIRNDFIVKFWEIDKNVWFTDKIVTWLEFIRNTFLNFFQDFPRISLFIGGLILSLATLSATILVLWPAVTALTGIFWALTASLWWATIWALTLRGALAFILWPIWLAIWAITAIAWVAYAYREELWFVAQKTEELTESQRKLNEIIDKQKESIEKLKNEQEELNKKYNEGIIWNKEYKESIEKNKDALDKLENSQRIVQNWLDIINDKQLTYKQKVEELNWLKLNDTQYQQLISVLRTAQQEALKLVQLNAKALQTKIAWLEKPQEVIKAEQELEIAYTLKPSSWQGWLVTNDTSKEFIKFSSAVANAKKQNSKIIAEYNKELETYREQEKKILDGMREAEDIIKKPTGSSTSWWSSWWTSSAQKQAEKEAKAREKLLLEEEKKEKERRLKLAKWKEEQAEKEQKKYKQNLDFLTEWYEDAGKVIDKVLKDATKNIEDINKKIESSLDNFKKLKDSLNDLENWKTTDLSSRYITVEDEIKKAQEDLKKMQVTDGISLNYAQQFWLDTLKQIWEDSELGGYKVWDLIKVLELNNDLNKLLEEQKLLKNNLSNEEIAEAQRYASLNPTQKILEEYEAKKKGIEEEIYMERVRIGELEILKQNEEAIIDKFTQAKENLDERYRVFKEDIETKITDNLVHEVNKRLKVLQDFEAQATQIANNIRNSIDSAQATGSLEQWFAEWGYTGPGGKYEPAGIVHKWEYVIPQHVLRKLPDLAPNLEKIRLWTHNPANQTYNNQKTISVWWITVQNKVDLETFFDKMKWKL